MRYIVEISYVGSDKFAGWQTQKNKVTYQEVCENAFSTVLNSKIALFASGRTDSGVSAIKQIAHFDYEKNLPKNFVGHVNSLLPEEVKILRVVEVDNDFHARFTAKEKTYKYFFYNNNNPIPFYDKFALQVKGNIDECKIKNQIYQLIGEHDFTSFCASGSSVLDCVRTVYNATFEKQGDLFVFTITGNGFLYNMVRIIVGTLIDIGQNKIQLSLHQIINKKDRSFAGKTAPAKGLVLFGVKYN